MGTLNTLYAAEQITRTQFEPNTFDLLNEFSVAITETRQALQDIFSFSVLVNPIKASKGEGDMSGGAMNMMSRKFGSATAAYSDLIFFLLYVPCISVLGAIARESSRSWMLLSVLWGVNVAYSMATLFYQVATFTQHPLYSATAIAAVIMVNGLLIACFYRYRDHFQLVVRGGILILLPAHRRRMLSLRRRGVQTDAAARRAGTDGQSGRPRPEPATEATPGDSRSNVRTVGDDGPGRASGKRRYGCRCLPLLLVQRQLPAALLSVAFAGHLVHRAQSK